MNEPVLILGCGYTGRRLAQRLLAGGFRVLGTTRHAEELNINGLTTIEFDALESLEPLRRLDAPVKVVYSIPILDPDPTDRIMAVLGNRATRVVYLSTTGVYGAATVVDEHTVAVPDSDAGRARIQAEEAVCARSWSCLVLRPAAIYGPERGIHVRMRQGIFRLAGDGSNYVSRIHVEDLAIHVEAALFSDVRGAWPVADDCPATSREVAEFGAGLLNVPLPESVDPGSLHVTRRANRRVDGSGIRRSLGIGLQYSGYRAGIRAALGLPC